MPNELIPEKRLRELEDALADSWPGGDHSTAARFGRSCPPDFESVPLTYLQARELIRGYKEGLKAVEALRLEGFYGTFTPDVWAKIAAGVASPFRRIQLQDALEQFVRPERALVSSDEEGGGE